MASWTDGYVADIGYTHGFYRELTPALLSFVGLVTESRVPDPTKALKYCELGCGQGFSTNLLASANPHIEFYATDFNPAHIVGANALAAEAGTTNVHFFDASFHEFLSRPDIPMFDVISLHGIYSWVAPEHRETIIEFIKRKLNPGGLVYISYNALPGWAAAMPLRRLFVDQAATSTGPILPRVDGALAFVEKLKNTGLGFFRPNSGMSERFEQIKSQDKSYLAHEYFNREWTPFYHSDVAADLTRAKCTFIGSAALLDHIHIVNLNAEQQTILAEITDPTLRETVRDFMVSQQFRRDVFVKGAVGLSPFESQQRWLESRFGLSTCREDVPLTVKGALGEATLQADSYNQLLDALADGPRTLRDLVAKTPSLAASPFAALKQMIAVLVGAGHVQPCLDQPNDSKRGRSIRAFNKAVLNRSQISADLRCLASPVSGGGISVGRIQQLFLLARQQKAEAVQFAWNVLNRQGQRILKDGHALATPEENLAELSAMAQSFQTKLLPVLDQLQVA